jgi:hypothetical protein
MHGHKEQSVEFRAEKRRVRIRPDITGRVTAFHIFMSHLVVLLVIRLLTKSFLSERKPLHFTVKYIVRNTVVRMMTLVSTDSF